MPVFVPRFIAWKSLEHLDIAMLLSKTFFFKKRTYWCEDLRLGPPIQLRSVRIVSSRGTGYWVFLNSWLDWSHFQHNYTKTKNNCSQHPHPQSACIRPWSSPCPAFPTKPCCSQSEANRCLLVVTCQSLPRLRGTGVLLVNLELSTECSVASCFSTYAPHERLLDEKIRPYPLSKCDKQRFNVQSIPVSHSWKEENEHYLNDRELVYAALNNIQIRTPPFQYLFMRWCTAQMYHLMSAGLIQTAIVTRKLRCRTCPQRSKSSSCWNDPDSISDQCAFSVHSTAAIAHYNMMATNHMDAILQTKAAAFAICTSFSDRACVKVLP